MTGAFPGCMYVLSNYQTQLRVIPPQAAVHAGTSDSSLNQALTAGRSYQTRPFPLALLAFLFMGLWEVVLGTLRLHHCKHNGI